MADPAAASGAGVVGEAYGTLRREGHDALLARYPEFFTGDFEWTPVLIGTIEGSRTYVGAEEFAAYWKDFTDAWGEIDAGPAEVDPLGGDRYLVEARLRVRGAGSGIPIDRDVAYLFEVRDGRIARGRSFFSRADALSYLSQEAAADA